MLEFVRNGRTHHWMITMRKSPNKLVFVLTILVVVVGVAIYVMEEDAWLDETGAEQEGILYNIDSGDQA